MWTLGAAVIDWSGDTLATLSLSCSVNSWNPFMEQLDLVKLMQISI